MFRWKIKAKGTAKASPETVWKVWEDVESWPNWDADLEWSRLEGPFAVGTKGKLKPKGWFASDFTITHIEHLRRHSDTTKMPFTTLVFDHVVTPIDDQQVEIEHSVTVSGLLAPLMWLTMRFQLKKSLPHAVNTLVKLVTNHTPL